ncbi:MAG: hypothetical protein KKD11_04145, partial [Candidatus Omnitrophica bacterium]|nr:hypothetical protein [Candidatus Omnitrophota bacterium]
MRDKVFILMVLGFLLAGCQSLPIEKAKDIRLGEEAPQWLISKNNRITLVYLSDINLKRLEGRLRSRWFSVSAVEKDLYTNPAYSVEQRIIARLEAILLRVEEILA